MTVLMQSVSNRTTVQHINAKTQERVTQPKNWELDGVGGFGAASSALASTPQLRSRASALSQWRMMLTKESVLRKTAQMPVGVPAQYVTRDKQALADLPYCLCSCEVATARHTARHCRCNAGPGRSAARRAERRGGRPRGYAVAAAATQHTAPQMPGAVPQPHRPSGAQSPAHRWCIALGPLQVGPGPCAQQACGQPACGHLLRQQLGPHPPALQTVDTTRDAHDDSNSPSA